MYFVLLDLHLDGLAFFIVSPGWEHISQFIAQATRAKDPFSKEDCIAKYQQIHAAPAGPQKIVAPSVAAAAAVVVVLLLLLLLRLRASGAACCGCGCTTTAVVLLLLLVLLVFFFFELGKG